MTGIQLMPVLPIPWRRISGGSEPISPNEIAGPSPLSVVLARVRSGLRTNNPARLKKSDKCCVIASNVYFGRVPLPVQTGAVAIAYRWRKKVGQAEEFLGEIRD